MTLALYLPGHPERRLPWTVRPAGVAGRTPESPDCLSPSRDSSGLVAVEQSKASTNGRPPCNPQVLTVSICPLDRVPHTSFDLNPSSSPPVQSSRNNIGLNSNGPLRVRHGLMADRLSRRPVGLGEICGERRSVTSGATVLGLKLTLRPKCGRLGPTTFSHDLPGRPGGSPRPPSGIRRGSPPLRSPLIRREACLRLAQS